MTGEFDTIRELFAPLAHPEWGRGLLDDVAVVPSRPGYDLILTKDALVEGVHFLADDPLDTVAQKLLRVNLSDLAAKGATPVGALLGFTLAGDSAWDARFAEGLAQVCARFDLPLLGGDSGAVPPGSTRVLGLTAIGRAARGAPPRSGARPGDTLWLVGEIGAAFAGYRHLTGAGAATDSEVAHFLRPTPRLAEGQAFAAAGASVMCDISDGLLRDAAHIAEASWVTLAIERAPVPFAASITADIANAALRWGDDYALLATLPPGVAPPCPAARIGYVRARGDAPLMLDGAAVTGSLGWEH